MTIFETKECKNCIMVDNICYGDDSRTCSGIVRNPNPVIDVIRLCQIPPSKSNELVDYVDMTLDEALDDSSLLSKAVSYYLKRSRKLNKQEIRYTSKT